MIKRIDFLLDRVTMYRLVLYVLIAQLVLAAILAFFHLLPFSPLSLGVSTALLVVLCWAMNTVFAYIFEVPTNVESSLITALILALILDPAQTPGGFCLLGWAAILAMASKYILAVRKKHFFNPAAIAVVITAFTLGESASWWVGTASMLPLVIIGGWLIARKLRQEEIVLIFCAAALVGITLFALLENKAILNELSQLVLQSPLVFVASIMLTEPLTAPPTKNGKRLYAVLTGVLILPLFHVGPVYSTPELALVASNVFSYLISPKQKVLLRLVKKLKVAPDMTDFVLAPSHPLNFTPGQYMEVTLDHAHPDSRGNRRYFTLASSPTEKVVHLGVRFYEKSSTFKQALYWMSQKDTLLGTQIAGDFTLPTDPNQKLVFLAGGIGITPFRSMLKYLLDTGQRRDIILVYANRTEKEIIYRDVLNAASTQLGIKIFYTLTDSQAVPRNWQGFMGRIDEQMLQMAIPNYQERTYYLSGPPEMVRAYEHVLRNMHVKRSQIKKDFFPGLV